MRTLLILLLAFSSESAAQAVTMRYALVIGNNNGLDSKGEMPFATLKHAEREARKLHQRLIRYSNFDPDENRSVLLLGADKEQVMQAVNQLAARMNRDRDKLGVTETVFLFYFTGHGLSGQLLLDRGPLTSQDLASVFKRIQADFTVSVFDACHAGSFENVLLGEKGIKSLPGLNLFRELPEEVLTTEGSIWFVSSQADQASYEDEKLGGVFTHFFSQALDRADTFGPGITLDSIWQYASEKTVEYTSNRNRRQVPQKLVAKLKSSSPLYFSFPRERNSNLVLSESVSGQFLLSYAGGQLTERFSKQSGQRRVLAVYPGKARLALLEKGKLRHFGKVVLEPNQNVTVRQRQDHAGTVNLGRRKQNLWKKGIGQQELAASASQNGLSALIGLGISLQMRPEDTLVPQQLYYLDIRLDWGNWFGSLRLAYGRDKSEFDAWSSVVETSSGEVLGGYAIDLGNFRVGMGLGLGLDRYWQEFDDEQSRNGWLVRPLTQLSILYPANKQFVVAVELRAGLNRAPGLGMQAPIEWSFWGGASLSLHYRFY